MPRKHTPRAEQCRDALPHVNDTERYIKSAKAAMRRHQVCAARDYLWVASQELSQARAALGK